MEHRSRQPSFAARVIENRGDHPGRGSRQQKKSTFPLALHLLFVKVYLYVLLRFPVAACALDPATLPAGFLPCLQLSRLAMS